MVGIIFERDPNENEVRVSYADEARISQEIAGLVADASRNLWTAIGQTREGGAVVLKLYTDGALAAVALIKRPGAAVRYRFAIPAEDFAELLEPTAQ